MGEGRSEDRILEQFLEAIGLPDDFSETVLDREPEPTPKRGGLRQPGGRISRLYIPHQILRYQSKTTRNVRDQG